MKTRKIGELDVTVVGLGCNNFGRRLDRDQSIEVVRAALHAGINFFDTADTYGPGLSEEYLGAALRAVDRSAVVVATKFAKPMGEGKRGASPAYIRQAVEDSLRRLGLDHIDLYQQHEPDATTPIEDTLATLSDLVEEGKVRQIGCSNFSPDELAEATSAPAKHHFVSVQNEYSLLQRHPDRVGMLDVCATHDITFLPYFPLAAGALTGKYLDGPAPGGRLDANARLASVLLTDENVDITRALSEYAADHGRTLLELAFSWLLARPMVASVIAGATSAEQVRANVGAAGWDLSPTDLAAIDELAPVRDIPQSLD